MELDVKKVMVLLQRKWNAVQEMSKLTRELDEVVARNDQVSAVLLLQLRADEMEKVEVCMEEIWQMGEAGPEAYRKLRTLIMSDPYESAGETLEEQKIFEIRRKTQDSLNALRAADQRMNRKLSGEKSFYQASTL